MCNGSHARARKLAPCETPAYPEGGLNFLCLQHSADRTGPAGGRCDRGPCVETADQADFFLSQSCDMLQGFLFTPPLPAPVMTYWLIQRGSDNLLPPPRITTGLDRHRSRTDKPH